VAWLAGIPLDKFMLDNTEAVKDLDAPLAGVNLLLCGPKPGEGGSEGPRGGGWGVTASMQCFCFEHIMMQCSAVLLL
jgi:hypothetical protein